MPDKIITEARELFELAANTEKDQREDALDDIRFARLGKQWPDNVRAERENSGRPCLTINKLPSYIRQVVNDSRQNKPSIRVSPVDSGADVDTAKIYSGLIRNIEYSSNADVAYDTAIDSAVTSGFGYWRVNIDYAHDDTFDMDLLIQRIANPFCVYGDPFATEADSSDWNVAFIVDKIKKNEFGRKYKGAENKGWESNYDSIEMPWLEEESLQIAEYWRREEIERAILLLSNKQIVDAEFYKKAADYFQVQKLAVIGERKTKSWKVTQRIMTGVEVLETNDWAGKYIPIVPVYGEEVNENGKRHFRSMIRDAKDPSKMLNYWRSASTELVALAPKAPYVGRAGAFKTDAAKWATANSKNHAYLEYDGGEAPQRQPFAGVPAGALQEAMNASDDIKAILGMFDPSMGERSNETSGRAIIARQRESDTGQFHFIDNLARAIRHTGRILIDLIPQVYTGDRVVRVLGEDSEAENVRLGDARQSIPGENGETQEIYNLSAGKYDVVVDTGPSYTTKRQEAAEQMTELMRVYPDAAPLIGDLLAKNLDWPGAEDIAARFKAMLPPQIKEADENSPEAAVMQQANAAVQQVQEQMQAMQQQAAQIIQKAQAEAQQLKMELAATKQNAAIEAEKLVIERYKAETERMQVMREAMHSEQPQETMQQVEANE